MTSPRHCPAPYAGSCQVTAAQLAHQRERELQQLQQQAEQQSLEKKRIVSEDAYAAAIEVQNLNRWVSAACTGLRFVAHKLSWGHQPLLCISGYCCGVGL